MADYPDGVMPVLAHFPVFSFIFLPAMFIGGVIFTNLMLGTVYESYQTELKSELCKAIAKRGTNIACPRPAVLTEFSAHFGGALADCRGGAQRRRTRGARAKRVRQAGVPEPPKRQK